MKKIKLKYAVSYSKKRGRYDALKLETYVTTDNLLQNKLGVKVATGLPPKGDSFQVYDKDDILISNIRPYLKKIWFANKSGICSSDVLNFSVQEGFVPEFVYYNLHRDGFFEHMMNGAKGTKMPRGDKNQILEFEIPDFHLSTQKRIADVLSSIDNKIRFNNQVNDNLSKRKLHSTPFPLFYLLF